MARDLETVTIDRRFRGPLRSANGGYACGLLGSRVGPAAEVTLRLPPPLERPLTWVLEWLHSSVGLTWGWSIVALTIMVRTILLPLTVRQIHSMQRLQRHALPAHFRIHALGRELPRDGRHWSWSKAEPDQSGGEPRLEAERILIRGQPNRARVREVQYLDRRQFRGVGL